MPTESLVTDTMCLDALPEGDYIVGLAASNFKSQVGTLVNYSKSTPYSSSESGAG